MQQRFYLNQRSQNFFLQGRLNSFFPILVCLLLGIVLSGCAAGRDVIDIMPAAGMAPSGMAVAKIVQVNDKRTFEAAPRDPSVPSLQNAKDLNDPAITARAYARKRGGFGNALGDIVLPEGRTVATLVKAATQKALEGKGYRVVEQGSPDFARAVPVNVDVQEFWVWDSPGAFTVSIEAQVTVSLNGAFMSGAPVKGYAITRGAIVTPKDFAETAQKALDDLSTKMATDIKSP
jgi:uncharacterized lipoprotein YajG